ncbi:alpha/beta-hydrolase [Coprinopsis marcescibilis]|uniref:triacylglycerol lipase n=1 Tax=Coprinopsis marcescibilis TaxID=230819 RepID=A0A5C3L528_COPMA|nr:alpha/beta-hydrolase [Coprinopsis marcescibilis]
MLPTTLTSILVPLLGWFTGHNVANEPHTTPAQPNRPPPQGPSSLQFELRHLHAVSPSSQILFHDVQQDEVQAWNQGHGQDSAMQYSIATRPVQRYRPSSFDDYEAARTNSMLTGEVSQLDWELDEIIGPDVEKRDVLLLLAKMSNDAYVDPTDPAWYPLDEGWNSSYPFGWEPDADGFRGHVFATTDNSTIVVSIKGTSAGLFGGGGPTAKKDKVNDNLLFSCCCARVDWTWTTVCGCYRGTGKCEQECLEKSLIEDSLFYPIGTNLYNNLTYLYPESNIWIIGHSLGGAIASLLGVTFGVPVVTFESPGEKLASRRLHMPVPPEVHQVTHIYHTADPIAMGTCNGVLSSCALGGYAMETACHLGKTIIYDTVTSAGWAVDIRTHGIVTIIDKLLSQPWPPSVDEGREVPPAKSQDDCIDCYSWEFT